MILVLFVLFSLGSLGRLSFLNQEINIYLYEISYAVFLVYLVAKYRLKPFKLYFEKMKPVYVFLGILTLTYIVSIFRFTFAQNIIAFLYFVRLSMYLKGIPYIAYHLRTQKKEFFNAVRIYALITAVLSIVQYIFYPNLRNLQYLGWDPHLYRMFGAVFDVSYAAALYGLIIIFFYVLDRKYGLVAPFFALLGLLTYDRGFYVSFMMTATAYLISMRKYFFIAVMIIVLAAALFMLPKKSGEGVNLLRSSTINSRLADYSSGMAIWRKNPILGTGYDHIRYVKPDVTQSSHAGAGFHSSYLTIMVGSGIVGLAAFLYMLWVFAGWGKAAFYSVVFLSAFSLFDNVWLHPLILFFEIFLLAYSLLPPSKA